MANSNKDTEVSVSIISVDHNIIYYGNTAINTNNISMISISPVPANKSWIYAVFIALVGMIIKNGGWLAILVAAVWIIAVTIHNQRRGENLAIFLNSGNTIYFHCRERYFLSEVVSKITECIKTGAESYTFNFDKCVINDNGTINNGIRIK